MAAVPEFDNSRPYQQIPFQYSLHKQETKESEVEHFEFLGDRLNDPREKLTIALLKELRDHGSIVVWNKTFEMTRLKEISRDFPKYADQLSLY